MSEKELIEKFKQHIESTHPHWRVKMEVPIGSMIADARIDEVDDTNIVQAIVAYVECKPANSDLKELLGGYMQALYYATQSGSNGWLAAPATSIKKIQESNTKLDPRVLLYNLDSNELVQTETIAERMSKSRMKRKMESNLFQGWTKDFTIETIAPIGVTTPIYADDKESVIFNLGPRMRGAIKEVAKTISGTLSDSIKFSLSVVPPTVIIAKKADLTMITKFVPNDRGGSAKRELYEIPAGKKLNFTVRCLNQRVTPEICENLIRQAGIFAGIGDSHSDGLHGRFNVLNHE